MDTWVLWAPCSAASTARNWGPCCCSSRRESCCPGERFPRWSSPLVDLIECITWYNHTNMIRAVCMIRVLLPRTRTRTRYNCSTGTIFVLMLLLPGIMHNCDAYTKHTGILTSVYKQLDLLVKLYFCTRYLRSLILVTWINFRGDACYTVFSPF